MSSQLFRTKSLANLLEEMKGEQRLRRVLGPVALTSLGVGCIIGTGIFVLTGVAAHDKAGPALTLSFVMAGMACVFAALCYAEFASMVPVAGSAYTYAYATLGELIAWIIGWDLVLEYSVASATVAHGWSAYFRDFLGLLGIRIPPEWSGAPFDYAAGGEGFRLTGAYFDVPAVAIAVFVTIILVIGIRESASVNAAMVMIKVAVVLFVIIVGAFYVNPDNWVPFAPFGYGGLFASGDPKGMLAGAALVFFAYIGFDSVSTHAEEARNPQRDEPIGILVSLVLCTILYIAVALVLTGMVPYDQIDIHAPISNAFIQRGIGYAGFLISLGALTGITSV
ncbi:MAG: amino acid permease, partial [Terriglobia bacterium]